MLLFHELEQTQCEFKSVRENIGTNRPTAEMLSKVVKMLEKFLELTNQSALGNSTDKIALTFSRVADPENTGIDASAVVTELHNIRDVVISEMWKQKFLHVRGDRAPYVDNDRLFGADVARSFPEAKEDIKAAGNCLAAECDTAAVFHLMRAVEWGLRAFCVFVGLRKAKLPRKKGSVSYVPLSHAEWEQLLNQAQVRVDNKIAKMKRGTNKQRLQEFYYPVLQDIRGFKEAFRLHVMHTRREYTGAEAEAILNHVKRFMVLLSSRLSTKDLYKS